MLSQLDLFLEFSARIARKENRAELSVVRLIRSAGQLISSCKQFLISDSHRRSANYEAYKRGQRRQQMSCE